MLCFPLYSFFFQMNRERFLHQDSWNPEFLFVSFLFSTHFFAETRATKNTGRSIVLYFFFTCRHKHSVYLSILFYYTPLSKFIDKHIVKCARARLSLDKRRGRAERGSEERRRAIFSHSLARML